MVAGMTVAVARFPRAEWEAADSGAATLDAAEQQHFAWLARSFGRTDYLPLTPSDLAAIASAGEFISKYPGTHLFKEGSDPEAAYVLKKGQVELYRTRAEGRRVISRVGEGAVIGDIALFQGQPYVSSARAIAGLNKLEATQRRLIRLMHRTVREQVAEMLLDEADAYGEVHLSQTSLATLLGASRQSINEALSEFRKADMVVTGYRMVRVIDDVGLAGVAGWV